MSLVLSHERNNKRQDHVSKQTFLTFSRHKKKHFLGFSVFTDMF